MYGRSSRTVSRDVKRWKRCLAKAPVGESVEPCCVEPVHPLPRQPGMPTTMVGALGEIAAAGVAARFVAERLCVPRDMGAPAAAAIRALARRLAR